MPVVRIDVSVNRSPEDLRAISDGVHRAFVDAIGVPEGDRFHILSQHPVEHLIADPEYLGIARQDVIFIHITLIKGRSDELKVALYRAIGENLAAIPGVRAEDVSIALVENAPVDYSYGSGEAQLLHAPPVAGTGPE
ncbi:tautomerase family protein [Actinomadura roseirufa]|uniref:tautomerase family protein n=1 Tax=Actinomadura roseirufa TaxID=2094049 RepID=UPI001040E6A6|nr:tautomerase family protein [Actinomadura roseirufa]